MRVSVVVPAFNEEKELPGALAAIRAALEAFAQSGWETELVVCDNNSTDGTASIARAAGAIVVFEPVNQISRARNAGARAAAGDWLIFIDADSHPSKELLDDARKAIESGDCIGGGSTVSSENMRGAAALAVGLWNGASRALRWAAGSFVFVEAAAFRAAGGFSEELFASEEIDFSRRLKRMARARRRRFVILHRHPLPTSNRKVALYGWGEALRFLVKTVATVGRTLRRREDCAPWYDGRR